MYKYFLLYQDRQLKRFNLIVWCHNEHTILFTKKGNSALMAMFVKSTLEGTLT